MNFSKGFGSRDFAYQIGLIGADARQISNVRETLARRVGELGFDPDDFSLLTGDAVLLRERRAPFVGVYFGRHGFEPSEASLLEDIRLDSCVIVPVVTSVERFSEMAPQVLHATNALALDPLDANYEMVVAVVLQQFRLLRKQRRLFISYRRIDSAFVAAQLYAALDARGFDVFLDTNGVPPGEEFQDVLWHRLADSDIVVLLDTVGFSESRWTQEELAKANSTNIQILHLLWPGQPERAESAFSVFRPLTEGDFRAGEFGVSGVLNDEAVRMVTIQVESLRARAIAARHRFLVDSFCDAARALGMEATVQVDRRIFVDGGRRRLVVVPMVGVPSAELLHDEVIEFPEPSLSEDVGLWAIFDERGLLPRVLGHIAWLNLKLPISAVPVFDVMARLSDEAA